jgi:translation elongation factor EF-G
MSQGRATFTMEFDRYSEVPNSMVEKMMEKEGR